MPTNESDAQPDFLPVSDRGESISMMEPLLLSSESKWRGQLTDLAFELTAKSAALENSLPHGVRIPLSTLVRTMNCYYSNLIEGHDTHPVFIEQAVHGLLSANAKKRDLQLEARAHVVVQEWIDSGAVTAPLATGTILEIHRRFCDELPPDFLWAKNSDTEEKIALVPGELRKHDVVVGRHVAISPAAIARFMSRHEQVYSKLGPSETILAAAAAHHRLLWIHPFLDGNGRVARLMSYSQLRLSLGSGGIWSVARGLARKVEEYKKHLMACDNERWNDYDGRGNLSEEALAQFTEYFLRVCIDQVDFMRSLVEPQKLRERILLWAEEESRNDNLLPNARAVLEAVLYRGELPRGDVPGVLGLGDRQSRRVVAGLIESGALTAASDRAPLRLAFPASIAHRWMPGLFPEPPDH